MKSYHTIRKDAYMKKNRFLLAIPVILTCFILFASIGKGEEKKELPKNIEVTIANKENTPKVRRTEISTIAPKILNKNGYTIKEVTFEIVGLNSDDITPFIRVETFPQRLTVADNIQDKKNKAFSYALEVPEDIDLKTYELRWIVTYKDLYDEEQTLSEPFYIEVVSPNAFIGSLRLVLDKFADWSGNYGWAVIILAILLKLLLYPLNMTSMKSQSQMQKLQPKIAEINKLYKDNPQKKSEEIMKLYKEEKINPASGCLPMLPQFAVIIALYSALQGYTPLYQSSFFWLKSLGSPDPFYIFPILAGVSTFLQSSSAGQNQDPQMKTMTYMMPLFFFFIMMRFPAALSLFWTIFGILSWIQQHYFNKKNKSSAKVIAPTPKLR
jgi:YidC/Oxa1 family membrane protein insertase